MKGIFCLFVIENRLGLFAKFRNQSQELTWVLGVQSLAHVSQGEYFV